jgi:hypothetical protein
MRLSIPVMRSRSAMARESAEVTCWALSGSSQRSGDGLACVLQLVDVGALQLRVRSVTSLTEASV